LLNDAMAKPALTGSAHTLSFEKLSAVDFERLCLWLVTREGFERAEHLGEAGNEQGRDVVAWKNGRRFAFQ
jgi:HJR/Mrr/RecB family endonuclease